MPARLLCAQGHHWDSDQGDTPCPVCGAAPVLPELAETLPPTAQPVPAHEAPTLAPGEQPVVTGHAVPASLRDHARYRVQELLGVGGMGAVWKAEHQLMERTVALKVINRELTGDTAAIKRFQREVKAVARLNHPNIVTAFDAEQAGDTHFLVMEYVRGQSLARLVGERGPLSVATACDCIRQAASGLQHAHELGHIHRDIKPQNLMLTPEGQVKILDFGLARLATERRAEEAHATDAAPSKLGGAHSLAGFLTHAGVVMGTPDYIAPEQVADPRLADIRADIYSLGCTFYHLLTGRVPFSGGSVVDKLMAHQEQAPRPVTEHRQDVPREVVGILERMLAKRPEDRYQTPGEVVRDLEQITQKGRTISRSRSSGRTVPSVLPATAEVRPTVTAATTPLPQPAPRLGQRSRWRAWLGCLAISLLSIGMLAVAGVMVVRYAIDYGTQKVKEVAPLFQDRSAREQLWRDLETDWQAPPPLIGPDKLFPPNIEGCSRSEAPGIANFNELGLSLPGRHAAYQSAGKKVDVYVFIVPRAARDDLLKKAEKNFADEKNIQWRFSTSGANASRLVLWRASPTLHRVVLWWCQDRLVVGSSTDGGDPEPALISYLRAIGKKADADPATPPRAESAPRGESASPVDKTPSP
jgi:serine/threonine protein kinase